MLPRLYKQDVADIRKHQINTLKIFNANVTEIEVDSEYEISFQAGIENLVLKISLGSDFPNEKPLLMIKPAVIHAWVNPNGVITSAPGLLNFTIHSDLGRVVQAIIREFQRNPPPLVNPATASITLYPSPSLSESSYSSSTQQKNGQHPALPFSIFPELNDFEIKELKFLNENEDYQVELINKLPIIKEQNHEINNLIQHIEDMAESNLKKEEILTQSKEKINFQIEEVTKLAFENERLFSLFQNLSEKYLPRNIQEELKKAAEKAEEESEIIAEAFLQGEIDVDKFVSQFIRTKASSQLRKSKEEKLTRQLDKLERAGF
ncbi:vacuolar protein sorting-associated protein 37A [Cylas formicarius]|uniref:vacuolar protein sorting-associated protein 37A n=1 Tax=Cylas formicarius TaxID=197179 RepID=UPI002958CB3A|nr:vacuolar protein sorting-associated protein 37A [Cylas formicarius]